MNIGFDGTIRRPTNAATVSAQQNIDPRIISDAANAAKGADELIRNIGEIGTSIYKLGATIREADYKVDSAKMRVDYAQRMEGVRAQMAQEQYSDVDSFMKAFEEKEAEARRGVIESAKGTGDKDGYFRNAAAMGGRIDEEMEFLRGNAFLGAMKSWHVRQRTQHYAEIDAGYQTAMQLGAEGGGAELLRTLVDADDRISPTLKKHEAERRALLLYTGKEREVINGTLVSLTSDAHAQAADAVLASPDSTYADFEAAEKRDVEQLDAQYSQAFANLEAKKQAALQQLDGDKDEHAAVRKKALSAEYDKQIKELASTREASVKSIRAHYAAVKSRGARLDKEEAERILRGEQLEPTRRNVQYLLEEETGGKTAKKSEKEKAAEFLAKVQSDLPAAAAKGEAGEIVENEDGKKFIALPEGFVPDINSTPEQAAEQLQASRMLDYKMYFLRYDYDHSPDMEELGDVLHQAHGELTPERYAQVFGVFRDKLLKKDSKVPADMVKNSVDVIEANARDELGVPAKNEKNNRKWRGDAEYLPIRNLIAAYAEQLSLATDISTFNQILDQANKKINEASAQKNMLSEIERMSADVAQGLRPEPIVQVPYVGEADDFEREGVRAQLLKDGRPYDDDAVDAEIERLNAQTNAEAEARLAEDASRLAQDERAALEVEAKKLGVRTQGRDDDAVREDIEYKRLVEEAKKRGIPTKKSFRQKARGYAGEPVGPVIYHDRTNDELRREIELYDLRELAKELGLSLADEDGDMFGLDDLRERIEEFQKISDKK